jgi:hypothetical protein
MKRPSVHLHVIIVCLSTVAAVLASPSSRPPAATFISFDVPGSTGTFPLDINADGDIVGRYGSGGRTHGFVRTADGAFTTIDYPGALLHSGRWHQQ